MQRIEKKQKTELTLVVSVEQLLKNLQDGQSRYADELLTFATIMMQPGNVNRLLLPNTYRLPDVMTVNLTCAAVVRRDSYGAYKIDLISHKNKIGAGGLSWVAPVVTLVKSNDGTELICKDKTDIRVGKVTIKDVPTHHLAPERATAQKQYVITLLNNRAVTEVDNMRALNQFNVRGPYHYVRHDPSLRVSNVFTMAHIPGADLYDIVAKDTILPSADLFDIQLQCFYKLQSQFHIRGMIHNDIKIENIRIDQTNGHWQARYLDCEFSRHESNNDYTGFLGTDCYIAPEMANRFEFSFKSDIYSLGITLRLLWNDRGFENIFAQSGRDSVLQARASHQWESHSAFPAKPDIPSSVYANLQNLLLTMTAFNISRRHTLSECIHLTEKLYLEFLCANISDDSERKRVSTTFNTATLFARKARKYSAKTLTNAHHVEVFKEKLFKHLTSLDDNQPSVIEFCKRQDEKCLQGIETLTDLHIKINDVISGFQSAYCQWEKFITSADAESHAHSFTIFTHKINNTAQNLDAILEQTKHIHRKIAKLNLGRSSISENDPHTDTEQPSSSLKK